MKNKDKKWYTEEEVKKFIGAGLLDLTEEDKLRWKVWFETSHLERQEMWKKLVSPFANQAEEDLEKEAIKKYENEQR